MTDSIFPSTWRYVPLRWDTGRRTWVNVIAFKSNPQIRALGEFHGVDVNGVAYFTRDGETHSVNGLPGTEGGMAAVAERDGRAVGIFVKHCRPQLVIIDCDSKLDTVGEGNTRRVRVRYGYDQLMALCRRQSETLPNAPLIKGNREGHRYLVFKQNPTSPIISRVIKAGGLAIDVIGSGHHLHWSSGDREVLSGVEMLDDPPELPSWFTGLIRTVRGPAVAQYDTWQGGNGVITDPSSDLGMMLIEAALRPVTRDGVAWNQRLFNASCLLAEAGLPLDEVRRLVLERCQPYDERERRLALDSVHSAWQRVTGEVASHD